MLLTEELTRLPCDPAKGDVTKNPVSWDDLR